jgi:murein tripeptide amidase MpaA
MQRHFLAADVAHLRRGVRGAFVGIVFCVVASSAAAADPICTAGQVGVSIDFAAGGHHRCVESSEGKLTLSVEPENKPINSSPWYAFRLDADAATELRVTLAYDGANHRYHPKWTVDGRIWKLLKNKVDVDNKNDRATFTIDLAKGTTFVAAQAIETPDAMLGWARNALGPAKFEEVEYGKSVDGRPLVAFRAGGEGGDGLIVALTRQHPPETTGAAAFRAFVERLVGDSAEARDFRSKHRILLAPMPNPDGVMRGNWRHNAGGKDLNRDWGEWTQPETSALGKLIESEAAHRRVVAFLDFHSTDHTVVYGPPIQNKSPTAAFVPHLRSTFERRLPALPSWSFSAKNPGASKNWALEQLSAPGMTVELDDNVTPDYARKLGEATAEAVLTFFVSN